METNLLEKRTKAEWQLNHRFDLEALRRWRIRRPIAEVLIPGFEIKPQDNENRRILESNVRSRTQIYQSAIINQGYDRSRIKTEDLQYVYNQMVLRLNTTPGTREAKERTDAERVFHAQIMETTKVSFHTNMWIGHRNFDFVFPDIAGFSNEYGRRHQGLVVELDGPEHDKYSKSRRDNSAESLCHSLKLALTRLSNTDVYSGRSRSLASEFGQINRLSNSRERNRVKTRIYTTTVFSWMSSEELSVLFGLDFFALESLSKKAGGCHV
ncbi:MAG: hypothetical protein ACK5W9_03240 [Bdellovibrionales bacterium]